LCVALDSAEPPEDLWWLSEHGIYRPRDDAEEVVLRLLPKEQPATGSRASSVRIELAGLLVHPRYKLPCHCFGYVGDASDPSTWKLPFCHADGSIDEKRLPKAIQAILKNYRGTTVHGIPENAIPAVLARLEEASRQLGQDARSVGDRPSISPPCRRARAASALSHLVVSGGGAPARAVDPTWFDEG